MSKSSFPPATKRSSVQVLKDILQGVLGSSATRYEIPLYQRTYDWKRAQFEKLWEDIKDLAESKSTDPTAEHFLGTLVLDSGHQMPSDRTYLVVDGQQRLTTLTMLLAAMRDVYKENFPDASDAAEIEENVLVHRHKTTHPERFRLWPTQADREIFVEIIDGNPSTSETSNLIEAYKYFRSELLKAVGNLNKSHLDRIQDATLNGLRFVTIVAEAGDNVYSIFESLNNTGLKLTQGDLLRNFFFSRLKNLSEATYDQYWRPMQDRLSRADLAHLFWLEHTWVNTEVKKDDTFKKQSQRMDSFSAEELREEVKYFNDLSKLLEIMRHPRKETDPSLQRALQRLVDFGIESIDPLVLGILSQRQQGNVTSSQASSALSVLESFLVRRLLVRAPHNALSRILMRAYSSIDFKNVEHSLRDYLSRDNKDYANDETVSEAVTSVNFYRSGTARQRKTLLSWLEEELAGNEPASLKKTTIEHVMPQNLTQEWITELSTDLGTFSSPEAVHATYVHTLANLTLSGYNSHLSNRPFKDKKKLLVEKSNIELNKSIAIEKHWTRNEIVKRGTQISELVAKLWIPPLEQKTSESTSLNRLPVNEALSQIPSARWVTIGDLAEACSTTISDLTLLLSVENIPLAWKILEANGSLDEHRILGGMPVDRRQAALLEDGINFDESGLAESVQRWHFHGNSTSDPINSEYSSGPVREFLDEAVNRLAPSLSGALSELVTKRMRQGDRVLFGVDPEDSEILTAQLPSNNNSSGGTTELRLTAANGIWVRRRGENDFEVSDPQTLLTDYSG